MKSVSLSHTYTHLLVLYELLFSLSDTHSCSFLWQDCSYRSSSVPRLSPCLPEVLTCMSSPSVSCKITTHIFFLHVCFHPTLSFSTGSFLWNPLSLTTLIHCFFDFPLQKVLSFYSIIKISPDCKSKSFFSVISALVTPLILITNVHLCFCSIGSSLGQDSSSSHMFIWCVPCSSLEYNCETSAEWILKLHISEHILTFYLSAHVLSCLL